MMKISALASLLLVPSLSVSAESLTLSPSLTPFKSELVAYRQGNKIGYGKRSLERKKTGLYQFNSETFAEIFIFKDERIERSTFFVNEKLNSLSYSFDHSGVASEKDNFLYFDAPTKTITQRKNKPVKAPWQHWFDELNYQQQLKLDIAAGKTEMEYAVIDRKGKQRTYKFAVVGKETLQLPIGEVNCIKVRRVRDNNKRETLIWFSTDHNYALARLWQAKKGKEQADLKLSQYQAFE